MLSIGNIAASLVYDSAISVADADAYHEKRGNPGWSGTEPEKEQALVKASDYARDVYGRVWSAATLAAVEVPTLLAQGVAELALVNRTSTSGTGQARSKKKVKIGPLEVEYDADSVSESKFINASRKFTSLLQGTSGVMVKLVRC